MGENLSDYVSETGYYWKLSDEERHCAERVADTIERFSDFELEHDTEEVLRVVSPWGHWCRLTLLFVKGRAPHFGVRLDRLDRLDAVRALMSTSPAIVKLGEHSRGPHYHNLWAEEANLEHLPDLVERILELG